MLIPRCQAAVATTLGGAACWRQYSAAPRRRRSCPFAPPSRTPACCRSGPQGIPIIKLSRIIYAVLALLSTTAGKPRYSRNHGVVRNPISQPLWGWKRWRCHVSTFGKIRDPGCSVFDRGCHRGNCGSAVLYPYRSLPAAGPTDRHSPPCQCDAGQCGARQALSYYGPYTRDNGLCTEDNTCNRGLDGITILTMTMTTTVNPSFPKTGTTAPIPRATTPT
jgi:hypothetical protein